MKKPAVVRETGHQSAAGAWVESAAGPVSISPVNPQTPITILVRGKRTWSNRVRVLARANAKGGTAEIQNMSFRFRFHNRDQMLQGRVERKR
jgi:hypothetical protein